MLHDSCNDAHIHRHSLVHTHARTQTHARAQTHTAHMMPVHTHKHAHTHMYTNACTHTLAHRIRRKKNNQFVNVVLHRMASAIVADKV